MYNLWKAIKILKELCLLLYIKKKKHKLPTSSIWLYGCTSYCIIYFILNMGSTSTVQYTTPETSQQKSQHKEYQKISEERATCRPQGKSPNDYDVQELLYDGRGHLLVTLAIGPESLICSELMCASFVSTVYRQSLTGYA